MESRSERRQMLRRDDLQNGYFIYQDPDQFCFGIDAVLLAHYPNIKNGDRVLDLGCGFAPIPFILCAEAEKRKKEIHVTGLELQKSVSDIAKRSVLENHQEDRISIVQGDLKEAAGLVGAASFSLVTCNPPYMPASGGLIGTSRSRAIARTELACTLDDVIRAASGCLKCSGRFDMIHRPFRLAEIFETMRKYHLEPKRMRMIYPYEDAEATMVLVEGVKGGKPYLHVDAPLVVYKKNRDYTDEVLRIYGKTEKE